MLQSFCFVLYNLGISCRLNSQIPPKKTFDLMSIGSSNRDHIALTPKRSGLHIPLSGISNTSAENFCYVAN